jgi:hypothetical protein
MPVANICRRHRILIAAAVAAVLGPRARVRGIAPAGWSQLQPGHQPVPRPSYRRRIQVHVRTARKEKLHEVANLA